MDLQIQQQIKEAAEKYGAENCVVILGTSDAESAEIYAETVTNGDPSFAGPLAEVPLGLPVYHVFEEVIREECDETQWKERISMLEAFFDSSALAAAVKSMRGAYSKTTL